MRIETAGCSCWEEAACAVVWRQPVFNARGRLVGYGLHLNGRLGSAEESAAELVTAACGDVGLRRVVGDHRAYIPASSQLLASAAVLRLPAEQVVLEVAEQPVDEQLLSSVRHACGEGFSVGVGGWALGPGGEALLQLAATIKVDFDFGALDLVRAVARRDELHARGATLIAGRVQTRGELEECRRLGFDAFQGEFMAQPALVARRRTPTFRMAAVAEALNATGDGAFEQLERAISADVGLAHRFLRLADSAVYARRARARSVRDALARLGAQAVRRWALMLALAGLTDTSSQTARVLLSIALHRARVCELLARQELAEDPDRAFTAGLLSVLPALVDRPIDELVAELSVDDRLAGALLDHLGAEGRLLAAMIAYEDGQRASADGFPPLLAAISRIYAESLLWADDTAYGLD
jgi:c-di-GMP phosphodiesterase